MYNSAMSLPEKPFKRIAMIARWKPVHLGQAAVIRGLCDAAESVTLGIGSSNRYNARNPFTLIETEEMLAIALAGRENVSVIPVPDLDDGPRWRLMVREILGENLDLFVTDNPYVANLLTEFYRIERPVAFVPLNERIRVNGTMVREAIARGEDWQTLVPPEIAEYISSRKLDERIRREFGLQILADAVKYI
jgi:nicotinamide-nucleotide adenylyltransferase